MRIQTGFVGQLRPPLVAVFAAVEACDAVEADVVPTLVAGQQEVLPATIEGAPPVTLSSDDVTRNLRTSTRYRRPEIEERVAKPSLWGRMLKVLKPDR